VDLPAFWAKYLGDAFWASMVFVSLGIVLPRHSTLTIAGIAGAVCGAVEISQLYHGPWIDLVRRTWLGKLSLGSQFAWPDFAAYFAGICFGGWVEWMVFRHCSGSQGARDQALPSTSSRS
jgi:hypothetical protein